MTSSWLSHERYPVLLLGLLLALAGALAIAPYDRSDWMLENALTVAGVAVLIATHRALPLSRVSYTLIFLFLCLHSIGAHYTYAKVPYDAWFEGLFGRTLSSLTGWQRNHFDRLVHLLYGLWLAYPVREVFLRVAAVRGFWGYYLPLDVVMSFSLLYELLEFAIAIFAAPEVGQSYLGTQGDEWDAQKDMALATLGGLIAITVTALVNWRYDRDFAKEFAASLRPDGSKPLGEARLRELRRK